MKCIVNDDVVLLRRLEGPLSAHIAAFAQWARDQGYATRRKPILALPDHLTSLPSGNGEPVFGHGDSAGVPAAGLGAGLLRAWISRDGRGTQPLLRRGVQSRFKRRMIASETRKDGI